MSECNHTFEYRRGARPTIHFLKPTQPGPYWFLKKGETKWEIYDVAYMSEGVLAAWRISSRSLTWDFRLDGETEGEWISILEPPNAKGEAQPPAKNL